MSKPTRSYTREFKDEAVKLALNSSSIAQAARDLGMPEPTLHTWVQKAKRSGEIIDASMEKPVRIGEVIEENQQLKKRIARLEQEKAILKKAATYFAKELG